MHARGVVCALTNTNKLNLSGLLSRFYFSLYAEHTLSFVSFAFSQTSMDTASEPLLIRSHFLLIEDFFFTFMPEFLAYLE